jgi:hypothetical protein
MQISGPEFLKKVPKTAENHVYLEKLVIFSGILPFDPPKKGHFLAKKGV